MLHKNKRSIKEVHSPYTLLRALVSDIDAHTISSCVKRRDAISSPTLVALTERYSRT